jgi:hypothetical protein
MSSEHAYLTRGRRALLLVAALTLPLMLTACEESDTEFLLDLAIEFAQEKGLLNADGSPNLGTMGQYALFGTTGDPEADAALDAGFVVKNLEDADQLAQEGAEEGDMNKINAAINARPGDWSYREQQAALLMAQGDMEGAEQAMAESDQLVFDRINEGGDCTTLRLNQLRHREQALTTQMQRNPTDAALLDQAEQSRQMVRTEIEGIQAGSPIYNSCAE